MRSACTPAKNGPGISGKLTSGHEPNATPDGQGAFKSATRLPIVRRATLASSPAVLTGPRRNLKSFDGWPVQSPFTTACPSKWQQNATFRRAETRQTENVRDKLSLLPVPRLMRGSGEHWRALSGSPEECGSHHA